MTREPLRRLFFYAFFGPKDARNTHGKILVQEPEKGEN